MSKDSTSQSKTRQYTAYFGVNCPVDSPKLYSIRKTALFGMFSLLSILLINIPVILENTYAYGEDSFETSEERSSIRVHFIIGSPVHPNLILDDDLHNLWSVEERTNLKKHFSYGKVASDQSYDVSTLDNFHEKRRQYF